MATMQKQKGKSYENKIADYLHDMLYAHVEEYKKFYNDFGNVNLKPRREKSSGTSKDADNDIDLGIASKWLNFSIECKHHKSVNEISLNAILDDKMSWLDKVMQQAQTHADTKQLLPVAIFRGNRTKDFVCVNISDFPELFQNIHLINYIVVKSFLILKLDDFMMLFLKKVNNDV